MFVSSFITNNFNLGFSLLLVFVPAFTIPTVYLSNASLKFYFFVAFFFVVVFFNINLFTCRFVRVTRRHAYSSPYLPPKQSPPQTRRFV